MNLWLGGGERNGNEGGDYGRIEMHMLSPEDQRYYDCYCITKVALQLMGDRQLIEKPRNTITIIIIIIIIIIDHK